MARLPIEDVLEDIKKNLSASSRAVLVAPPGAGKTTRVPLMLLHEPWLNGRKIIMLEPRRLAARAAARYMALLLGEKVGETVGYRVKLDSKVSSSTRIEVVTEGILTRMLQGDPALESVGAVIFDEFHERNLQADLGLALCLESQAVLRPDLRLLVMSATLEAGRIASLMNDAPVIESEGLAFPVETIYLSRPVTERLEFVVVHTITEALKKYCGDILVFLPGIREIRRVESALKEVCYNTAVKVAPLYGNLPLEEQDLAIVPCLPGERKVVLATAIAETSLTVEGVTIVIDSGLMRIPRFSPRTGMTRLETIQVARAAADQRRGRAGRLRPGICYRLWTKEEDMRLIDNRPPEILEADLAPLTLELALWGTTNPKDLLWLDPPPEGAMNQALELLYSLGALDGRGRITKHGRQMAECGIHPRLAHMIIKAIPLQLGGLACELAALLGERDLLPNVREADIRLRIEALRREWRVADSSVDLSIVRKVCAEFSHLMKVFGIMERHQRGSSDSCGLLLAFAYPDRIAQRRANGKYLLQNGRGAVLIDGQVLADPSYLVAGELSDQGVDSRILLAAPVAVHDLVHYFADIIRELVVVVWDSTAQAVRARRYEKLGAIVIKEEPFLNAEPEMILEALLAGIKEEGLNILPWTRSARRFQQRVIFMHRQENEWPDVTEQVLITTLDEWLAPYLYGLNSRSDLQKLNLESILENMLSWEQRQQLDIHAPTHITVPSGQRIPIDYSNPEVPVLAVRLQEMFGLRETPSIASGRVALTLHLLSPAQRPVQVTKDLASFWQSTYFEVKKDMAGRYPKHYWPDDPLAAVPTHRVRPRN